LFPFALLKAKRPKRVRKLWRRKPRRLAVALVQPPAPPPSFPYAILVVKHQKQTKKYWRQNPRKRRLLAKFLPHFHPHKLPHHH